MIKQCLRILELELQSDMWMLRNNLRHNFLTFGHINRHTDGA